MQAREVHNQRQVTDEFGKYFEQSYVLFWTMLWALHTNHVLLVGKITLVVLSRMLTDKLKLETLSQKVNET